MPGSSTAQPANVATPATAAFGFVVHARLAPPAVVEREGHRARIGRDGVATRVDDVHHRLRSERDVVHRAARRGREPETRGGADRDRGALARRVAQGSVGRSEREGARTVDRATREGRDAVHRGDRAVIAGQRGRRDRRAEARQRERDGAGVGRDDGSRRVFDRDDRLRREGKAAGRVTRLRVERELRGRTGRDRVRRGHADNRRQSGSADRAEEVRVTEREDAAVARRRTSSRCPSASQPYRRWAGSDGSRPVEPWNCASPNAKIPPSDATIQ